ncbi:MAG: hypothetical protein ACLRZH_03465 [Ruthenibacterium lactatiformans]
MQKMPKGRAADCRRAGRISHGGLYHHRSRRGGLFAAGAAVHAGKRVTVLEHMDAPGKSCSLQARGGAMSPTTAVRMSFEKCAPQSAFLYSALNACPPAFVMELLKRAGRAA